MNWQGFRCGSMANYECVKAWQEKRFQVEGRGSTPISAD